MIIFREDDFLIHQVIYKIQDHLHHLLHIHLLIIVIYQTFQNLHHYYFIVLLLATFKHDQMISLSYLLNFKEQQVC